MKSRPADSFVVLVLALTVISCSSAPPRKDSITDAKDRAAQAAASGNSHMQQGRYELALQFFSQALSLNASVDNREGIVQSYNSIGQAYLAMDRVDKAEEAFAQARANAGNKSPALSFASLVNLGELYLRKGRPAEAIPLFNDALALPGGRLTAGQKAVIFHDLGAAYKGTGDYPAALENLGKALRIDLDGRLFEQAAADYYMIASVHSKQGNFDEAAKNAQSALEYDKRIENSPGISKDLFALGLIARKRGDEAGAYDWFERSYMASASLSLTSDARKAIAELIVSAEALGRDEDARLWKTRLAEGGKK